MIKKLFFATLFMIIFSSQNCAYSKDITKINLDDAIQLSISNNLDLQSSRIEVELAKNEVQASNRLQNPDLNIFYNYRKAGKSEPQQIGLTQLIEVAKRSPRKNLEKANLFQKELEVKLEEFTLEMDVRENTNIIYDSQEDDLPDETVFISLKTPNYNSKLPEFDLI